MGEVEPLDSVPSGRWQQLSELSTADTTAAVDVVAVGAAAAAGEAAESAGPAGRESLAEESAVMTLLPECGEGSVCREEFESPPPGALLLAFQFMETGISRSVEWDV